MKRRLINILLIALTLAILFIIGRDFIGRKAGKSFENPYKYEMDEYWKVDSSAILYHETITFPVNSDSLKGVAISGKQILVLSEKFFLTYDYAGKELSRFELPDTANCLATAGADTVWIGMRHYIAGFDKNGKLQQKWQNFGHRSFITSLAASGNSVYVADAGNRIVYQCDLKGNILAKIGERDEQKGIPGYVIPSPYFDLALDDSGFLWVANTGRHTFENYNRDGSLRTSWGITSMKLDGFFGCCNPAQFALMADNSFITSEKGIPRIKIYDQDGRFKGVVAPPASFQNGHYAPDVAVDADQRIIALDIDRRQVRIFELNKNGNK
jgi:hypothetical protein